MPQPRSSTWVDESILAASANSLVARMPRVWNWVEWSELRDGQRLIFGRDRRQCRLDAVGEAKGAIVFAYFDVCIGHGGFLLEKSLIGTLGQGRDWSVVSWSLARTSRSKPQELPAALSW